MKLVHVLLGVLIITTATFRAKAQAVTAGLYTTADDFLNQKITYPVDCSDVSDKLRVNNLFESTSGIIKSKGKKHRFYKVNFYGYRNCKNENFRFDYKTPYQIIDTTGFFIYYRSVQAEPVKGKGLVKTDAYFFSTKADNTIQPLTMDNLKKAFPGNHSFQYALDDHFRNDKDLAAYDTFQKTYKVKYLYGQSLK
jgi:hypothetical protein